MYCFWRLLKGRENRPLIDLLTNQRHTTIKRDYKRRLLCVKGLAGKHRTRHLGFISSISVHTVPLGGAVYTLHTALLTTRACVFVRIATLDAVINVCHSSRWQRAMVLGFSVGSESGAVKCSALTASPAAPYTASDPLFSPISTAWHQPVFSRGGCGISRWGEGNNHTYPSQLTDLLKRSPLDKRWRVLEIGIRPPPKKGNSSSTAGLLVQVSHSRAHTRAHARYAHAQPRLNKHCKLAGRGCRLFSIWIVGRGGKKWTRQFIWVEFYWGWFKWKKSLGHKTQIKLHHTHSNKNTHTHTQM